MSAFDLNRASTPFEENDDREIRDHHLPIHNSNSDSSFSCTPDLLTAAALRHQSADYCMSYQFHQLQREPKELIFIPGSSDRAMPRPTDDIKLSLCDAYGAAEDGGGDRAAGKYWMSSKMRIMRKMMNSTAHIIVSKSMENMATARGDHEFDANSSNRSGYDRNSPGSVVVRVCSDCKTTKTPLWRSGPRGPKSLCNACGIRQRKARRAMAAAAAAALNGGVIPAAAPAAAPVKGRKEKKLDIDRTLPFKKRCKTNYTATTATTAMNASTAAKKLCFEDRVTLSSNNNSAAAPAIQKAFPEDERDAAVLLMALSCGLIRS